MFSRFWANFDKLLLAAFAVYFTLMGAAAIFLIVYFMLHVSNGANPEIVDILERFMAAMMDNSKYILGALVGLITGVAIGKRQSDANGGSAPPAAPPVPVPSSPNVPAVKTP